MPTLLFRLRHVPEDEANDIRQLLDDAHIDWYETAPGNWGISMPAIWLSEDDDAARARALLDRYQQERAAQSRTHYRERVAAGEQAGILARVKQRPVATTGIVLFCAFIVYVSLKPIWQMLHFQP